MHGIACNTPPGSALLRQNWHGLSASMQMHEMLYIRRAGVAGIALRAGWEHELITPPQLWN
ncbi:hypothetical protein FEV48_05185 [Pectobacterium carotovorum subsp. carotovorum]|nr:hypothetical protein FEV48_05185 [Pectobacterium carotovorum subsp. carotovorum]